VQYNGIQVGEVSQLKLDPRDPRKVIARIRVAADTPIKVDATAKLGLLGLTVFLITHDLDTLYAICDRVAVLADRKVLINAPLAEVERFDHPWVQEYFHGPRGRAAQAAKQEE
jgi:ABC-type sugar transport system ATPase subunit